MGRSSKRGKQAGQGSAGEAETTRLVRAETGSHMQEQGVREKNTRSRRRRPFICGRGPATSKAPPSRSCRTRGCLTNAHFAAVHRNAGGWAQGFARLGPAVWGPAAASRGAPARTLAAPRLLSAVRRAPMALWTQPNSIRPSSHDPTKIWRESHGRVLIPSQAGPERWPREGGTQPVSFGLVPREKQSCLPAGCFSLRASQQEGGKTDGSLVGGPREGLVDTPRPASHGCH